MLSQDTRRTDEGMTGSGGGVERRSRMGVWLAIDEMETQKGIA